MKPVIHLIATDPDDLKVQVNKALEEQLDLYTPLFVSDEGLLCQRVVPASMGIYEYRLIVAKDLDDLQTQEVNLMELDFDYIFNVVMWNGKYLQWMCRMKNAGLTLRDAVALSVDTAADIYTAERSDELKLVEGVREALHMEPASQGRWMVTIPFPLVRS